MIKLITLLYEPLVRPFSTQHLLSNVYKSLLKIPYQARFKRFLKYIQTFITSMPPCALDRNFHYVSFRFMLLNSPGGSILQ